MITPASFKTVYLVVMLCSGDPREQNCGEEFAPETWVASTQVQAKNECEKFLARDFEPSDYVELKPDEYVAVRCE